MADAANKPNVPSGAKKERKKAERKDPATRFGLATFKQLRPAMQMADAIMEAGGIPDPEVIQKAGELNAAIARWCSPK